MELLFGLILAFCKAEECPDRQTMLEQSQTALLQGLLSESATGITIVEHSFSCGPPVSSQELGQFMMLRGAHYFFLDQPTGAQLYFRAASDLHAWNDVYGPQLQQLYNATQQDDVDMITLSLKLPRQYNLYLDGTPQDLPVQTKSNYHLIQVIDPNGHIYFSQLHYVQTDHTISIPPPPTTHSRPLLLAAIGTGSSSIISGILAHKKNEAMYNAQSLEELDKHYLQQRILIGFSGISLGATGVLFLFW